MDFVGAVGGVVEVDAAGVFDQTFAHCVACAVRVEVVDGHWVDFIVDEPVRVPIYSWVDPQGENVLMVGGKHAGMDNCTPGNVDTFVDRLRADDAGGTDFVGELAGLIEDEGHNVFVVGDGDDGLDNKFAAANDCCVTSTVIGVLPTDAGILLMDANDIWHWHWFTFVSRKNGIQIVNRAQAITAELEIVCHGSSPSITKIKSCLSMKRRPRVRIGNIQVG